MDVKLQIDTAQLDKWTAQVPRRLPAGVAFAINNTVYRVRDEKLFPRIHSLFFIRGAASEAFFFGAPGRPGGAAGKFPKSAHATSQRLSAEFGTAAMEQRRVGGKGGPILLAGFETGAERTPHTPHAKSIAVPMIGRPARPSILGPVPSAYRVANLKLRAYYRGAKIVRKQRGGHQRGMGVFANYGYLNLSGVEGLQWKGLQRTFLLPHSKRAPQGGIFQRIGRGRDGVQLIYKFIPPFRLDRRLGYEATVQREAPAIFHEEMDAALDWALNRETEKQLRSIMGGMLS